MKKTKCFYCRKQGLPLFGFPQDPNIKNKWLEFCREVGDVTSSARLCILHFDENDVSIVKKLHRLKKNAVPKLKDDNLDDVPRIDRTLKRTPRCFLCQIRDVNRAYFSFPSNPTRRKLWLQYCIGAEEDVELHSTQFLCEIHFSDNDLIKNRGRTSLKPKAIPKIPFASTSHSSLEYQIEERQFLTFNVKKNSINVPASNSITEIERENPTLNNNVDQSDDTLRALNEIYEPEILILENNTSTTTNDSQSNNECNSQIKSKNPDEPLKFTLHSNCDTCVEFLDHIRPQLPQNLEDTRRNIDSCIVIETPTRKRRRSYLGDFTSSDFASPKRAEQAFNVAKEKAFKFRKLLRYANEQLKRRDAKITRYEDMIKCLREKVSLSENVEWL